MTKQEIIDELNKRGVTFDPAAKKDDLATLLGSQPAVAEAANQAPAPVEEPPTETPPPAASELPADLTAPPSDPSVTGPIPESEIIEKVRAGLTRDQAIEVINSQREHDGKPPLSAAELIAAGADAGDIPEEEVIAKVRAGLDREQAIEVIRNQRAHDAASAS